MLVHYVENLQRFKNTTGVSDKKKITSEEFNKWMACLLIVNLYQSKYSSLENGLASQYSKKNNQYLKDLISAADIMKNDWRDDYGTRKPEHKISKHKNFNKQNNSGQKEE